MYRYRYTNWRESQYWRGSATMNVRDFVFRSLPNQKKSLSEIGEYRDRLIADVVTGQIDVRGWKPGPGDEIADEDLTILATTNDSSLDDMDIPEE